jgi:DNA-binding MarR family transcriptional regulator
MSNGFSGSETEPEPTSEGYDEGVTGLSRLLAEHMRAFSLESSFFLQAVGDRLGMASPDFACLTLLLIEGPVSAGALAERTGLTTGAITGLIDRLERGGWVRRTADPADRRRVIVEPLLARAAALRPLFDPMLREAAEVEQHFDADERGAIVDFIEQSTEMLSAQVRRLREVLESEPSGRREPEGPVGASDPDPTGAGDRHGRPGVTWVARRGRLDAYLGVSVGGTDLRIRVDDLADNLCAVDFGDRPAVVTAHDGRVEVSRSGRGRWRSRRSGAEIVLHSGVSWEIALRGGASRLDIDLGAGRLTSLSIAGGANSVHLVLPRPTSLVAVHLSGGASQVSASRPAGVPVSARVRGGAVRVTVDGVSLTSAGGKATLGRAADIGYAFDINGGASSVEVVAA